MKKNKSGHGGKRAGSGSKPRLIAVGKTVTVNNVTCGGGPIVIVIEEIKDGVAYGVDEYGDVWTFQSKYEAVEPCAASFEDQERRLSEHAALFSAENVDSLDLSEPLKDLMKNLSAAILNDGILPGTVFRAPKEG